MNKTEKKPILQLFLRMLYISTFTFGGGFVIVTFMKRIFVDELHWIEEDEMLDMTALAQSSPGAIAVNGAILVGWHVGGFVGMVAAVIGTILPPMIILVVVSAFYEIFSTNQWVALALKGMQAGVAAVILDVVCGLSSNVIRSRKISGYVILVAAFVATVWFHVNVIYIILAAIFVGVIMELVNRKKCGQTMLRNERKKR